MKKITILFSLFVVFFASCREDGIDTASFQVNKLTVSDIAPAGGTDTLLVTSTVEWIASANEPWVSVSPANGIGNTKCIVFVDSTLQNDVRTAELTFETVDGDRHVVMVAQGGFAKFISPKDTIMTIASSTNSISDRYFEVEVSTNVGFKVSIVDSANNPIHWLTPKQAEVVPNFDRPSRPRSAKVRFDWDINSDTFERVAYINFLPIDEKDVLAKAAVLTVTQDAAPVITDDRAGDSLAIVTIINRLQLLSPWDVTENMQYWNNVTLWESTDEGLPCPEAVGRVRKASFMMCKTKESLPQELRFLKYIETLNIYSNVNTMLLSIDLGSEICDLEYLKHLQIGAFGLVSLPDDFVKLGDKLESLDLNSNNFPEVPAVLTPDNFPELKSLNLLACRRWTTSDLRKRDSYENGIGLYFNTNESDDLHRLLLWENLEELRLSNCYIEGQIPDFKIDDVVGGDTIVAWAKEDITINGVVNDTLINLVEELADTAQYRPLPKILPKMKRLTLNLNFFTGKLPDWLLYHPHLLDWFPESLIYMQQVNAYDSNGKAAKFDNEPSDYEKYFDFFPGYREKYEIKEEIEE